MLIIKNNLFTKPQKIVYYKLEYRRNHCILGFRAKTTSLASVGTLNLSGHQFWVAVVKRINCPTPLHFRHPHHMLSPHASSVVDGVDDGRSRGCGHVDGLFQDAGGSVSLGGAGDAPIPRSDGASRHFHHLLASHLLATHHRYSKPRYIHE